MRDERQGELELHSAAPVLTTSDVARVFEPARLTQARVLAELTKAELAEKVHVSAAAVGQYETGAIRPRPDLLPKLARTLGVPVEFFTAGRPLGRVDAADAHFRSLRSTRAKDRAKAATHAEQLWELTHALEARVQLPPVDLPGIGEGMAPGTAARALRSAWGIGAGPVAHLASTMEDHGIVVGLIPMTDEAVTRVSAYSTWAGDRPIVIVTPERAESVYRFRFTCAHELGHLLLHPNPRPGDRIQEREADEFAAEFLTPRTEIEPFLPKTMRLNVLARLSSTWGVSTESLVRRMGECRIVSDISVRRAYQRLNALSDLRQDGPLLSYPGEVPSLLRDALALAERHGLTRVELASELCWSTRQLAKMLGEDDPRPRLRLVRSKAP
jgi:Zn-dependent peptidase ImmA (M78 family)/transcriptional regulator with XRE-family HTH domain